ncbi:MAG: DUF4412 domain-containing protein [Nitrospiraceae bacterium]|nr:DUF4412 domain-containing protein [Nitrospiraceae bacterium]OQW67330.1 MAG: hypothetical protein BVN29_03465 [Nitrospira sp. ST-bin5]
MSRRLSTVLVLAGLLVSTPLWAVQLSRPQVEYSADSVMQTEEGTIEQHIYATPTKERQELLTAGGDGVAMIFRYDTKLMWQLMPSEHMYMEHSLEKAAAQSKGKDLSKWDFEETVVGEEVLEGVKVTKYKTIATSTDGKKYGGFSWRTKEGIAVKQDLLYKEGNEKHRMTTELKNLKIGKQDPKLFEVPEGFTKFDMAGMMGGMMGRESMGMPQGERGSARRSRPAVAPPADDAPAAPERDQSTGADDIKKAGDMMKKLFGR